MRRREQELLNKIKEQQKALETMKQEKMKVSVPHFRGRILDLIFKSRLDFISIGRLGCVVNTSLSFKVTKFFWRVIIQLIY